MDERTHGPDLAILTLLVVWLALRGLALVARTVAIHGAALVLVLAGWTPSRAPAAAIAPQPLPANRAPVEHHQPTAEKPARPRARRRAAKPCPATAPAP